MPNRVEYLILDTLQLKVKLPHLTFKDGLKYIGHVFVRGKLKNGLSLHSLFDLFSISLTIDLKLGRSVYQLFK